MVVANSQKQHTCTGHYRIEVDGHRYKLFKDGREIFVFAKTTFASGGVGLKSQNEVIFTIDNFNVVRLIR
jgi:hypothetical protein